MAEKHLQRLEAPKAHALNPRSLEICAAAGLPMDRIHALATSTAEGGHVRMVETLSRPPIGAIAYERQDAAVRDLTPWPLINIEQPKFEAVIEDAVRATPDATLRRGLEWQEALQLGDQVVSTLLDRTTGETVKVGTGRTDVEGGAGLEGREEREKEGGEGEMIRRGWLERVRVGLEGEDAREVPQVEAVVREGGREDEREGASEARVAAGASGMGEGEAAAEWEGEEVGVPAVAVRGGRRG